MVFRFDPRATQATYLQWIEAANVLMYTPEVDGNKIASQALNLVTLGIADQAATVIVGHDVEGNKVGGWERIAAGVQLASAFIPIGRVGEVGATIAVNAAEEIGNLAAEESIAGRGYQSFAAFKYAEGAAGEGMVWHHIVEQRVANVEKFGAEAIHNTENVVSVPRELNQKIANFYSTKQSFSGNETVRQWLGKQSFEKQTDFGIKTMNKLGAQ